MKIETKFNPGDIGYTIYDNDFMIIEIQKVEIKIDKKSNIIIKYFGFDAFGDDSLLELYEENLFKNTNDLKAYINDEIKDLLDRHDTKVKGGYYD